MAISLTRGVGYLGTKTLVHRIALSPASTQRLPPTAEKGRMTTTDIVTGVVIFWASTVYNSRPHVICRL